MNGHRPSVSTNEENPSERQRTYSGLAARCNRSSTHIRWQQKLTYTRCLPATHTLQSSLYLLQPVYKIYLKASVNSHPISLTFSALAFLVAITPSCTEDARVKNITMHIQIKYSLTIVLVSQVHFHEAVNYLRERILIKEFSYKFFHHL